MSDLNIDKFKNFIMKLNLESKLFILAVIFGMAWIYGMITKLDATYIDSIKSMVFLIIGAFLTRYSGKEGKK